MARVLTYTLLPALFDNISNKDRFFQQTGIKVNSTDMENQPPQDQTLGDTDYDSNEFDAATTDDEAAAMESGVELDDDE
jgi:hypothetical protein